MGDFNCDLSNVNNRTSLLAAKLSHILDQYNLYNTIKEPTRVTPETQTVIDLIVTSNKQLINRAGTIPLGVSDHNLIYAKLTIKTSRPKSKIVTTRNYKTFNEKNSARTFKSHLSKCARFLMTRTTRTGLGPNYTTTSAIATHRGRK